MHFIHSILSLLAMFAAGFVIGAYMDHRMYQGILREAKQRRKPLSLGSMITFDPTVGVLEDNTDYRNSQKSKA